MKPQDRIGEIVRTDTTSAGDLVVEIKLDDGPFTEGMRRARDLSTPTVGNPRAQAKTTAEALDELRRSYAELFRQMSVAMAQATDGLKAFGQALTRGMRRKRASVELAPVRHGFTPSLDLVCGVCGVGPEECRGGRP